MATFNKFNDFVLQQNKGTHDFSTHTFKLVFTNTAPVATNSLRADLTEIAAGNGYTTGGLTVSGLAVSQTGGVCSVKADKAVLTASGGSIGPFRYVSLYNNTATNKNLVCWWTYPSAITLLDGESFEWRPSDQDTAGEVFNDQ